MVEMVPVSKVGRWLDELYGRCHNEVKDVSKLSGIPTRTLKDIREGKSQHVLKETAEGIIRGLLIARRGSYRPPDKWVTLEPSAWLRAKTVAARTERNLFQSHKIAA